MRPLCLLSALARVDRPFRLFSQSPPETPVIAKPVIRIIGSGIVQVVRRLRAQIRKSDLDSQMRPYSAKGFVVWVGFRSRTASAGSALSKGTIDAIVKHRDKPRAGVRAPPGGFADSNAAQGKGRESGGDLPLGDGGQTRGSSPERPSDDLRGIPLAAAARKRRLTTSDPVAGLGARIVGRESRWRSGRAAPGV